MNKTKLKGKANKIVGGAREYAGRVTGKDRVEADGLAQESKGEAQTAIGNLKDKADHVKDKVKKAVKH